MEMTKRVELVSPIRDVDNLSLLAKQLNGEIVGQRRFMFWRKKVEYCFQDTDDVMSFLESIKNVFGKRVRMAKKTY